MLRYIKRGAGRPFRCFDVTVKKVVDTLLAPMEPLFTALVGLNQSTQDCNTGIILSILSSNLQPSKLHLLKTMTLPTVLSRVETRDLHRIDP